MSAWCQILASWSAALAIVRMARSLEPTLSATDLELPFGKADHLSFTCHVAHRAAGLWAGVCRQPGMRRCLCFCALDSALILGPTARPAGGAQNISIQSTGAVGAFLYGWKNSAN